jgi:hypothetical protein
VVHAWRASLLFSCYSEPLQPLLQLGHPWICIQLLNGMASRRLNEEEVLSYIIDLLVPDAGHSEQAIRAIEEQHDANRMTTTTGSHSLHPDLP